MTFPIVSNQQESGLVSRHNVYTLVDWLTCALASVNTCTTLTFPCRAAMVRALSPLCRQKNGQFIYYIPFLDRDVNLHV